MNVLAARVAFRERPLVDVIDLSLRFVVVHARDYAKVALAVILPTFLASWGAASLGGWILGWTVAIALSSLATIPFTILASRLVFEDLPQTRDVLAAALRDLPGVVVVRTLSLLAFALGLVVLVVPAVWFGAVIFFVDEVKLLERADLTPAFARAQRLATSSFGTALMAYLLFLVLDRKSVV